MKMHDTFFDGLRFWNLCRKDLLESWKVSLLRLFAVYGILAVIFLWNGLDTCKYSYLPDEDITVDPMWNLEYWVGGFWGLFIFGSIAASFAMERLKGKTGRIAWLMTPATVFEKFFSRWLLTSVCFVLAYWVVFHLADLTRVAVCAMVYPGKEFVMPLPLFPRVAAESQISEGIVGYSTLGILVCLYCFLHSFFMLGSTVWPRNALVKTFAAGIAVCVVYIAVGDFFWGLAHDDGSHWDNGYVSEETGMCVVCVLAAILACVNWILAYFRFKESEIINRW